MSTKLRRSIALAAQALAVVAIGAASSLSLAQPQEAPRATMVAKVGAPHVETLEQWFWMCDYAATTRRAISSAMTECYAVTEEFKNVKFGGDFHEMLDWWRLNKPTEHDKIRQLERTR